jgi:hypothetical protein
MSGAGRFIKWASIAFSIFLVSSDCPLNNQAGLNSGRLPA